jgi:hypothetical protein
MKIAVKTVMSVGRATIFAVGLAVILAVVLGVATTANAAAGDPLKLGKLNTVGKITQLVSGVAGPSLRIDNNSAEFGATALRLEVEPGKPPMSVNSTTEVNGLNVDSLDSLNSSDFLQESSDRDDFLPNRTYDTSNVEPGPGGGGRAFTSVQCDPGDKLLGGGGQGDSFQDLLRASGTTLFGEEEWRVVVQDNGEPSSILAEAICADFPPLR